MYPFVSLFSSTDWEKTGTVRAVLVRARRHSEVFAKVWMGPGRHRGGGRELLPLLGPQRPAGGSFQVAERLVNSAGDANSSQSLARAWSPY